MTRSSRSRRLDTNYWTSLRYSSFPCAFRGQQHCEGTNKPSSCSSPLLCLLRSLTSGQRTETWFQCLILRSQPPLDLLSNLIAYSAKDLPAISIGTLCISGIVKTPMQLDVSSRIRRAGSLGVITDRNDIVEMSSLKFGNVL